MKRRLLLILLVAFSASTLVAQSGTAVDAPSTRDDILKLFEVMHVREQMRAVMEQVMQQTRSMGREALKKRHPEVTDEELARLDTMSQQTMKDVPIEGMLDDMVPVYQKHMNKADVEAMVGFYSSATGQKMLREMPAMTAEGMQAVYPRLQKQMDATMQRVEEMEKENLQKKDSSPKPQPKD